MSILGTIDNPLHIGKEMLMTAWDINTSVLFWSLIKQFSQVDLFMDVGSLDGTQSFNAERSFPEATVIAFEANPANAAQIRGEVKRRRSRVLLEEIAVGNTNGKAVFHLATPDKGNKGMSSLLDRTDSPTRGDADEISVDLRRLDSIPVGDAKSIVLWLDLEGAGFQALEGMAGISDRVKFVHIEVETEEVWKGQKMARDIVTLMRGYGLVVAGTSLNETLDNKQQGDIVFMRPDSLPEKVLLRAVSKARMTQRLRLFGGVVRNVLPLSLYEKIRNSIYKYIS